MRDINESISEFAEEVSATAGALVVLIEEARSAVERLEGVAATHSVEIQRAVATASAAAARAERAERRADSAVGEFLAAAPGSAASRGVVAAWPALIVAAAVAIVMAVALGAVLGVQLERDFQRRDRPAEIVR